MQVNLHYNIDFVAVVSEYLWAPFFFCLVTLSSSVYIAVYIFPQTQRIPLFVLLCTGL